MKKRVVIISISIVAVLLTLIFGYIVSGKDISGYYNTIEKARYDNDRTAVAYENGTLIYTKKMDNGYVDFLFYNDDLYVVTFRNKYKGSIEKYQYQGYNKISNMDYKISQNTENLNAEKAIDFEEVDLFFGFDFSEKIIRCCVMKERCDFGVEVSSYCFIYKNTEYFLYVNYND